MKVTLFQIAILMGTLGLGHVWGNEPVVNKPGQAPSGGSSPDASTSAAIPPMADIHDIRPLVAPGLDPWLLYGLALALLIGILLALWIIYLRRHRRRDVEPVVRVEPPDVIALEALKKLEPLADIDARRFYFQLSAIIRGYLQQRFEIAALEMTIEELLPAMDRIDLDESLRHKLNQLLRVAEPVKFAGRPATRDRMASDLAFANAFVTQTTPDEQA